MTEKNCFIVLQWSSDVSQSTLQNIHIEKSQNAAALSIIMILLVSQCEN